jgi:hypothetical protein
MLGSGQLLALQCVRRQNGVDDMSISTTNVETARWLLGIGKHTAYEQVRAGQFPGLIPLGGTRHRVSLFAIADRLGCTVDDVRRMITERENVAERQTEQLTAVA